jgi:Flp pilus assembly protein TadG
MTMNRIDSRQNKAERGTAIVEAAIIITIFFMFLFGIFEAGRFLNTQQVLTNAAREGARFAVTPLSGTNTLPTDTEISNRVDEYLSSASISGQTVTVTEPSVVTGTITTTYKNVKVEKTYQVLTVPYFFSMLNVTLKGEALMREEISD